MNRVEGVRIGTRRRGLKLRLIGLGLLVAIGGAAAQKNDMSAAEAKRFLKGMQKAVISAAKAANPSVVNISAEKTVRRDPFWDFFDEGGSRTAQSLGSGVIIKPDGVIVTNNHVVAGAERITITLGDNRTFRATLVGQDPSTDLAVLKVDARGLPALRWGNSDALEVGEFVIAIGNPFGLKQTVTSGIVSGKGRQDLGIEGIEDFIQTDAAINPGNSGGALIDLDGNLVGINTAIYSQGGGSNGIGFAIPAKMAREVAEELIKNGKAMRGWMGLIPRDSRDRKGVFVWRIYRNSPASRLGLASGDRILAVNDKPIESVAQLRRMIMSFRPNERITLRIEHEGTTESRVLTLGELPHATDGRLIPGV